MFLQRNSDSPPEEICEERKMRLTKLLSKIEESLRKKYHIKLPQDPVQLYDYLLKNHEKDINKLLKKNVLKQDQYDLLFPQNKKTDSMTFDVTLLVLQLRSFWFKKPPAGKTWDEWPDNNDNSDVAHLNRIRLTRNLIQHSQQSIDENTFLDIFKKVTPSLIAFGTKPKDIENIKTCKQRNTFSLREFFISLMCFIVVPFAIYFGYHYVTEHPSNESYNIVTKVWQRSDFFIKLNINSELFTNGDIFKIECLSLTSCDHIIG